MELFSQVMQYTLQLFMMEFTIWGYTFSYFEVFIYSVVACIACIVLGEIFLGR